MVAKIGCDSSLEEQPGAGYHPIERSCDLKHLNHSLTELTEG